MLARVQEAEGAAAALRTGSFGMESQLQCCMRNNRHGGPVGISKMAKGLSHQPMYQEDLTGYRHPPQVPYLLAHLKFYILTV